MSQPTPTILGIRHHGPGSARSVHEALARIKPDIVLIEGPPDAQAVLHLALHADMQPPVALLLYPPGEPQRAVYYPFAVFSPEWQALRYTLQHEVPARLIDLPQAHQFAMPSARDDQADRAETNTDADAVRHDPLRAIAQASGYHDSERWWEHLVEQRQDSTGLFEAVGELMTTLRAAYDPSAATAHHDRLREAYMRQQIRAAQREGFRRIAVVCGAWHAPALAALPPAADDDHVLRNLPRVEVAATWVPWTYGRLVWASGYGAGIESPGYYEHLWETPDRVAVRWMARVAYLLRAHDLQASSASVIEAVRLADALAAVRNRPLPGLPELLEAAQAVLCYGDTTPLRLIETRLIVGERLGSIPAETPMLPLQREQQRLRMQPEATERVLDLDLRKPLDLERSQLLHRLRLLEVAWGNPEHARGKGTFHEVWRLQWQPEFVIAMVEASVWGTTIVDAATAYVCDQAAHAAALPALTQLVERTLVAELTTAIAALMDHLLDVGARASDVPHLMDALPPLAQVLRYGNVRQTDTATIAAVVDGFVARIAVGLPPACAALNDEAAEAMAKRMLHTHSAIDLIQQTAYQAHWLRSCLASPLKQNNHDRRTTSTTQQPIN